MQVLATAIAAIDLTGKRCELGQGLQSSRSTSGCKLVAPDSGSRSQSQGVFGKVRPRVRTWTLIREASMRHEKKTYRALAELALQLRDLTVARACCRVLLWCCK
jgi:hypothetical protein